MAAGKTSRASGLAISLAVISLLLSGACLIWVYLQEVAWQELGARMADLEAEHDYLLDREADGQKDVPAVVVASRLEGGPHHGHHGRPDLCSLLPDPGPCGSQVMRWYYLDREEDCLEFPWGGCQGNENNFLSLEQCRAACHVPADKARPPHLTFSHNHQQQQARLRLPAAAAAPSQPADGTLDPSSCSLPPESGPCADRITRFYHEDGTCKRFQYGGCAGNANNFFTEGECWRSCGVGPAAAGEAEGAEPTPPAQVGVSGLQREGRRRPPVRDVCLLPEDPGSCEGSEIRYRWDAAAGLCRSFRWGGCAGNGNNFISEEKCRKRCAGPTS